MIRGIISTTVVLGLILGACGGSDSDTIDDAENCTALLAAANAIFDSADGFTDTDFERLFLKGRLLQVEAEADGDTAEAALCAANFSEQAVQNIFDDIADDLGTT
jgi:hypothetical protein